MSDADLARAAQRLLGALVGVAADDPSAPAQGLWPAEASGAAAMAERRRREFAAGRRAARGALHAIGHEPAAIPIGPDRAPGWPPGLVGSISHSARRCLAAVARRGALSGLGIDLEPDADLPEPLWGAILTPDERRRVTAGGTGAARLATLIFSAKEAAYKCQHPLTGALLDLQDLEIDLDLKRGVFACRFADPMPAIGRIDGRFAFAAEHVLTTATIDPPAAKLRTAFTNNYPI